jgi:hypothetical protein
MNLMQEAHNKCKTHKERAEQQLIQSLGSLKSLEWCIFHDVLLLASLPLDDKNILDIMDGSPIITK